MWLRGKCANCGSKIAFRYFAVELLTALFFLAVWLAFPWPIALVYWIFVSLLIVATFIDFEHFIIPDEDHNRRDRGGCAGEHRLA